MHKQALMELQRTQNPKKTCVQELNVKINLDDESCQYIKDKAEEVCKENTLLKAENK